MAKVHVICGGDSAEREVSLRSGDAVTRALKEADYKVQLLDSATATIDEIIDCDVVFPVLHGAGGEDGELQAELEKHAAKYVGSDPKASQLCFDKWQYRQAIEAADLPVAVGALVQAHDYHKHPLAQEYFVLKPLKGGSSIDTHVVRDPSDIPYDLIADTFGNYPTMLIEELIIGTELTVGILGQTPLPVIEIIPPIDGEFDYENKYNGATQELCPPKHVSKAIQQKAQALALKAHKLAGCRDLSRTDIMVDKSGKLYLLETNTIPGMTDRSLFPKMAATAGITMPELCQQLVEMALSR
ncbi:MAG: D-alanine--D-alanine ligase [Candidatus Saccharimonadales bacterium]